MVLINAVMFGLPLENPVFIFAFLAILILIIPFLSKFFRVPDIAWYIIAGVLIGPYGFNLLEYDKSIVLLGTIGLLYIMFIAGLELSLRDFALNRRHSVIFGLYTFVVPLLLGLVVCRYALNYNIISSLLVSIIFSTHTLIAYPIVSRLGITKDISVMTAVGGTIITDTLVLLILSFITSDISGENSLWPLFRLISLFAVYLVFVGFFYPWFSNWFFKYVKKEKPVQYVFLLVMVFISASLAILIGIEPIIGAFMAGLALNKSVSKNPTLVQNVEFVGNALFIPLFLISVGMLIDVSVLTKGIKIWEITVILLVVAITGKWLAAWFTQLTLRYSVIQRNVLFGLSSSHAAATIAVIMIGFSKGIIDIYVFNAIIIIILVSCLIASFVTEYSGRTMARSLKYVALKDKKHHQKIMVPVANPDNIKNLIEFALSLRGQNISEPVHALTVQEDAVNIKEKIGLINQKLEGAFAGYNDLHKNIMIVNRIDVNVTHGIVRASKENDITDIVMGWGDRIYTGQKIFGAVVDQVIELSWLNVYLCHFKNQVGAFKNINIILPPFCESEPGFGKLFSNIIKLSFKEIINFSVYLRPDTKNNLITGLGSLKQKNIVYKEYNKIKDFLNISKITEDENLNILFYPRKYHVSYSSEVENFQKQFVGSMKNSSYIILVIGHEGEKYFATGVQGIGILS